MTIKRIITFSCILLCVAVAALIASLVVVDRSNDAIDSALKIRSVSLALADELRESSRGLTAAVREFSVTGDERFVTTYMDIVAVRAGEKSRPTDRSIAPGQKISLDDLMKQAGFTEKEFALLRQSGSLSNDLIVLETVAINAVRGKFPDDKGNFTITGEPDKAKAAELVFSPAYNGEVAKIMAPFTQFEKELDARLDAATVAAQNNYAYSMLLLRVVIAVLVAMFVGFLLLVSKVIVRPVLQCDAFATQVAGGNLDTSLAYTNSNEIGSLANSLRTMVQSLRERVTLAEKATAEAKEQSGLASSAVAEAMQAKQEAESAKSLGMRQAGEQLLGIAEKAKEVALELSRHVERAVQGATTQQKKLADSSRAMEELNRAIMDVAHSTSDTTQSADETRQNAVRGAGIVGEMAQSIGVVDAKAAALQQSLDQLGQQAEGIGKVMAVISDIADQTNLLALNAAIEAARAGDAGRGFAVVADEVRKLAEKTMQATGEVGNVVRAIQQGTKDNIRGMQDASAAVKTSTDLASSAGESLQLIVTIAEGTAEKIHSIATAAEEQSATCEQIAITTESINGVAGETLNVMSDAGSAVAKLNDAVQQLLTLTESLRSA